jgi:hypothetical protein
MMLWRTHTGVIVALPGKQPLHALALVPLHARLFSPGCLQAKIGMTKEVTA